jgi:hypothetical protein
MERQEDVEAYRVLGAKVDHDAEYIEQLRAEMIGRVRVVATGKTAKQ